ncbi:hypothetical protein [Vibrio owensii]|uniref:hypothetical protein n=1 Tax=Vibrio owensii TaxID=696485 RepID=UPI004068D4A2
MYKKNKLAVTLIAFFILFNTFLIVLCAQSYFSLSNDRKLFEETSLLIESAYIGELQEHEDLFEVATKHLGFKSVSLVTANTDIKPAVTFWSANFNDGTNTMVFGVSENKEWFNRQGALIIMSDPPAFEIK